MGGKSAERFGPGSGTGGGVHGAIPRQLILAAVRTITQMNSQNYLRNDGRGLVFTAADSLHHSGTPRTRVPPRPE